ncbi:MAG TPA: hypothetical protein GXX63_07005 [Tissierellia bacterium]|nr:hypothetical protein [Tissierellia bacterium]
MEELKIEVELLTESIFGSGQSIPGDVDLEIVYDEYGFPYMKSKTFKGNLREQVEKVISILKDEPYGLNYAEYVERLFGSENNGLNNWKTLKFSDCQLDKDIKEVLVYAIRNGKVNKNEIMRSLTDVRSFTSIDNNGISKDGTLRHVRVIKKGLKFNVTVSCGRQLEDIELSILAAGVSSLRHIGTMRTRGKGQIKSRLLIDKGNELIDITDKYVNKLMEEVKKSE